SNWSRLSKSRVRVSFTRTGAKCPTGPSYVRPKICAKNRADASLSCAGTMVWFSVIAIRHLQNIAICHGIVPPAHAAPHLTYKYKDRPGRGIGQDSKRAWSVLSSTIDVPSLNALREGGALNCAPSADAVAGRDSQ